MKLADLLEEHFRYAPGLHVYAVGSHCMIHWIPVRYQMDGTGCPLDMSRDHLVISLKESQVWVRRIDCGDKVLHDEPWMTFDVHDPQLIKEIWKIIRHL